MNKYELAYNSASIEHSRRPKNIDVNETLAWASYHNQKYKEAQYYILKALNTGSKNAELLYKAGLILEKNNHPLIAKTYFKNAMQVNPTIQFPNPTLASASIK